MLDWLRENIAVLVAVSLVGFFSQRLGQMLLNSEAPKAPFWVLKFRHWRLRRAQAKLANASDELAQYRGSLPIGTPVNYIDRKDWHDKVSTSSVPVLYGTVLAKSDVDSLVRFSKRSIGAWGTAENLAEPIETTITPEGIASHRGGRRPNAAGPGWEVGPVPPNEELEYRVKRSQVRVSKLRDRI